MVDGRVKTSLVKTGYHHLKSELASVILSFFLNSSIWYCISVCLHNKTQLFGSSSDLRETKCDCIPICTMNLSGNDQLMLETSVFILVNVAFWGRRDS